MEGRGSPAAGPSGGGGGGGEGDRDELGTCGVGFGSTAEVRRRQLGQITNWEKPVAGGEDANAVLLP